MDLSKIMTISGKSGLFKLVAQTKTGAIVESLSDMKRFPVFTHEKISTLEEISVFTTGEDLSLKDVLKRMYDKEEGKACPDPHADGAALRNYFESVIPEFDPERVYNSDIKKILSWYNLLLEHQLLDFTEESAETGQVENPDQPAQPEDEQSNS